MKRKEKLAKEFIERIGWARSKSHEEAYLAGFEKAREMARSYAWNYCTNPECGDVSVGIEELGEEEVG